MSVKIKCPKCKEEFELTDAGYQDILSQVKNSEFNKEIERLQKENELRYLDKAKALKLEAENEKNKAISLLNEKINSLNHLLETQKNEEKHAISDAVNQKEQELIKLKFQLEEAHKDQEIIIASLKDQHNKEVAGLKEQVGYYKDLKSKLSTKMVGETLEQHCSIEFNRLRPLFKNAYFAKDNDVSSSGSKGDFIYRDYSDDQVEFLSIMFEMKNENDTTASKHKNEDFLKELDKDRHEKNCEYAVLVSLLEIDNELYNQGIVDVSHLYPKMYVIRPQFFIPLITMLRNAALNTVEVKKELVNVKTQNLDIVNFENNLNTFKDAFGKNYRLASSHFENAIAEIDKTIAHLQKVRDELTGSTNNLRLANDKAEALSIKKLTKNSPLLAEQFKK